MMMNNLRTLIFKLLCIIGLTAFRYKGDWYRVSGYVYRKTDEEGNNYDTMLPKWFCNHIHGSALCGVTIRFNQIEAIRFRFKYSWWRIREENIKEIPCRWFNKVRWGRYWFWVNMPEGATIDEICDKLADDTMRAYYMPRRFSIFAPFQIFFGNNKTKTI